jgi:hypothetical protein
MLLHNASHKWNCQANNRHPNPDLFHFCLNGEHPLVRKTVVSYGHIQSGVQPRNEEKWDYCTICTYARQAQPATFVGWEGLDDDLSIVRNPNI